MQPLSDAEFFRIVTFVRERYGVNLEKKRTLIEARLSYMISRLGFNSYGSYLREVLTHPEGPLCQGMINRLSTNYTFFFREPGSFAYLLRRALPDYEPRRQGALELWCAACASGEEAYSLSMALSRFVLPQGRPFSYRILATDVNTEMLERARLGQYGAAALTAIPAEYRRLVRLENNILTVAPHIAAPIRWQWENLLQCERRSCVDVIFCRNVMIYFAQEERLRLVERLHAALRPGGFLFISATESIDFGRKLFQRLEPAIYRKTETAS